ncbi:hypothetical protein D9611_002512 [Ephemerocybe angulata]|uniref:Uncharacterized protein n=1 Tax=Ephemerocybe angulata TaxID=980116 RepID=A0A8H5C3G1_9AGAR|nr:hypothetical protein D9611_002512 [Tulosesus angulatus]
MLRGANTKNEVRKRASKRLGIGSHVALATASTDIHTDSIPGTRGQPPSISLLPLSPLDPAKPRNKRPKRLKAGSTPDSKLIDTGVKASNRVAPSAYSSSGLGGVKDPNGKNHRTLNTVTPDTLPIHSTTPLADHHSGQNLNRNGNTSRPATLGSTLLAQVRQCIQHETEKWGRKPFVMDVVLDLKASWAESAVGPPATVRTQQSLIVCENGEGVAVPRGAAGTVFYRTYEFTDLQSLDAYWADQSDLWRNFSTESGASRERYSIIGDGGEEEPVGAGLEDWGALDKCLRGPIGNSRFPVSRERSTVTWPSATLDK